MRLLPALFLSLLGAACASPAELRTPGGRLAAHLEAVPYDRAHHLDTCKVFHHVFAPDGRRLTKGLGGEFEHHRGLFLGWNQIRWNGRKLDLWHCRNGETMRAVGMLFDGDVQEVAVHWCAEDGTPFVREVRRLRALDDGPNVVLELQSELLALTGPVELDGDPQHAGQQFRALQDFAPADAPKVTYVRPAEAQGGKDDLWTGCHWTAAVLPLPDGPVTVIRTEGHGNPRPTRWSTRPYGRFGATFTTRLEPFQPLHLAWRYVIAPGALDATACAALAMPATDGG